MKAREKADIEDSDLRVINSFVEFDQLLNGKKTLKCLMYISSALS